MITITVKKRKKDYLEFCSRARRLRPAGQDIVCAAVSALIINTVNSLERFTQEEFEASDDDGFVRIRFAGAMTAEGRLLMDSLILGLTEIAHDYNNRYLTVNVKEV